MRILALQVGIDKGAVVEFMLRSGRGTKFNQSIFASMLQI
jgi:hypothetical protein